MKVYTCKFRSCFGYCGGLIVVAANSEEDAYNTVKNSDRYRGFYYEYDDGYLRENFTLLPNVVANVDTPQVLAEDHYLE